jgi:nucleotide-binding universal stress UspA family protein
MAKPILVGYDAKTSDRAPVLFGVAAARLTGAPLIVATVGAAQPGSDGHSAAHLEDDLLADASEALARVGADLEREGISIEVRRLESTSAARALHEAAEAEDAGLLVVGSTRRGQVGRVLPGSTTERLMHGAPCAIAVVPHEWQPRGGLTTIGVAYVESPEGREALHSAHALARVAGATLRVLTVAKVGFASYGETDATRPEHRGRDFEEVEGEHRVRTEQAVRNAVASLGDDVPLEVDAFLEDPADTLIRVSEHLDLLVCGSRGYGPLRAVLLGGVSRRVTAEAHCPVIVLPRGVESPLPALMSAAPGATPS